MVRTPSAAGQRFRSLARPIPHLPTGGQTWNGQAERAPHLARGQSFVAAPGEFLSSVCNRRDGCMILAVLAPKDLGWLSVGRRDQIREGERKMKRIFLTLGFLGAFAVSALPQTAAPSSPAAPAAGGQTAPPAK